MVIAIIGVLAALILPALSNARARAARARCLANLKQCAALVALYADDHDSRMFLYTSQIVVPAKSWARVLYTTVGGSQMNTAAFLCPAYPPLKFADDWKTVFGIRRDPPDVCLEARAGGQEIYMDLTKAPKPADYLLLADTTSSGRDGYNAQQFHEFQAAQPDQVHARHDNMANGTFVDGHAETCGRQRLTALGIQALYGSDGYGGYFP